MSSFRSQDAREVPGAIRRLYQDYRESLPKFKQTLVSPIMPAHLLEYPGLVCLQGDSPVASISWREAVPGIVSAEFYAENPRASIKAVEFLIGKFLARTSRAASLYFELWTSPHSRVHQVLCEKKFQPLKRQLLAFRKPVNSAARWNEFRFVSLRNFRDSLGGTQSLAAFLHEAYRGTVDCEFYDEYRDLCHCQSYLARVLASPYCDFQNSWIAWSPQANKVAGLALCYLWPGARGLYLEQLAVHPSFRRKGLGQVLFSRVSSALNESALTRIIATVSIHNQPAIRLYQAAGADVVDLEIAYVRKAPSTERNTNSEATTSSTQHLESCASSFSSTVST
jgi:ribosomal protein S18 acetylase RimI-like enzyme